MKKKGSLTIEQLIKWIVVVVVIVIIIFALWMFFTGQINWGKGIPIPGQQNASIKIESATFRYLPALDRVEYYTGTSWEGFEGKSVDIGDKRVVYEVMKKNFREYYLSMSRNSERVISLPHKGADFYQAEDFYRDLPAMSAKINQITPLSAGGFSGGDVVVGLYSFADVNSEKSGAKYGELVVNLQGGIRWNRVYTKEGVLVEPKKGAKVPSGEDVSVIIEGAAAWRDSVLKEPVSLSVSTLKGTKESGKETNAYCPEKITYQGEVSLVVRLEQPALGGRCS